MKSYECALKKLIDFSNSHPEMVFCDSIDKSISFGDLKFLKAKGLIKLKSSGDNGYYAAVSESGITYFSDKHDKNVSFIKEHFFKFISGFASGILVTVVSFLLLQNK